MNIQDASNLLKVLADESRLTIVKTILKNKKMIGNDLLEYVGCKQATLSHHMAELTESGLVIAKKDGNKVFYSVNKIKIAALSNFLAIKGENEPVIEEHVEVIKPVEKVVEQPKVDQYADVSDDQFFDDFFDEE